MGSQRLLGIILLVLGIGLLYFAYQGSQSVADQTKQFFTGNFRDQTMWMFLGGCASAVAGVLAILTPNRQLGGA